jgi:antitoxin YefM
LGVELDWKIPAPCFRGALCRLLALLILSSIMYGITVQLDNGGIVDSVSVNKFRDNLKSFVEQIVTEHAPLKVTRRSGEDFVVVSADDWEREQETLFVLQNKSLMKQIAASLQTHNQEGGYKPTQDEMDEITGI